MRRLRFERPWALAISGITTIGLIIYGHRKRIAPPPLGRVALIGDSYAVGLGPELQKLFPEFRYEGHVGTNTWQWAHGTRCGDCGSWLRVFGPKVVLVSLGVNDGDKPERSNYQDIIRMIHGLGARVIWIQPPAMLATPSHAMIASLGVQTVPPTTTPLSADNLHPASYGPWAQEVAQVVRGS